MVFTLESSNFRNDSIIPDHLTCQGDGSSPELHWYDPPYGTVSYLLVMVDPDAPGGTFIHWVMYNIPNTITRLLENQVTGQLALNSAGTRDYYSPCPPSGESHMYALSLYALDTYLPTSDYLEVLWNHASSHILGRALLRGAVYASY